MKKILVFIFILFVSFSLEAQNKSWDSYVEAGWVIPDGFHLGGTFRYLYFGFNVINAKDVVVNKDLVYVNSLTDYGTIGYPIDAKGVHFQFPIGFQYKFLKKNIGLSVRAAWIPAVLYAVGQVHYSYVDDDIWHSPWGQVYIWDSTSLEWLRVNSSIEEYSFKGNIFELSFIGHFKYNINGTLGVVFDSSEFRNSKIFVAIGYSFTRFFEGSNR